MPKFVRGLSNTGSTGATTLTRWVGGTASVAPTTGTFSTGDFVISLTGSVWVCSSGGTPGTWVSAGGLTQVAADARYIQQDPADFSADYEGAHGLVAEGNSGSGGNVQFDGGAAHNGANDAFGGQIRATGGSFSGSLFGGAVELNGGDNSSGEAGGVDIFGGDGTTLGGGIVLMPGTGATPGSVLVRAYASGKSITVDNSGIALAGPAAFDTIPTVPDDAYDASAWNGSTGVPTKNAIRDKIESLGSGGAEDQEILGWMNVV